MQPSSVTDMDVDGSLPLSWLPPTLAPSGTVLPHDIESKQLVDKASHLNLATSSSSRAGASPAAPGPGDLPISSRTRSRACSACSSTASSQPFSGQRKHAMASPAVVDAQLAPPTVHELAHEAQGMELTGGATWDERDFHGMPLTEDLPLMLVRSGASLADLPNEVLLHILGYLDVCDLLLLSRTSHQFRTLALAPILHRHRLRHAARVLPPLLTSPSRPSLAELIHRRVFLTNTTVVSRKLARSLTAIRLSRRLAVRPPPEALIARGVLPRERERVAPALLAKTRAIERERVKDGLRRWVGSVWERRWREVVEERRQGEERFGVGRVWRLRRFWESVGRGEIGAR